MLGVVDHLALRCGGRRRRVALRARRSRAARPRGSANATTSVLRLADEARRFRALPQRLSADADRTVRQTTTIADVGAGRGDRCTFGTSSEHEHEAARDRSPETSHDRSREAARELAKSPTHASCSDHGVSTVAPRVPRDSSASWQARASSSAKFWPTWTFTAPRPITPKTFDALSSSSARVTT